MHMAERIETTKVVHFPIHPFGKHAGTYAISITLARNYEGDPIPHYEGDLIPLSGCSLSDPLDEDAKTVLCGLALARIDSGGRFEVDYKALRAHLRTACGVLSDDLSGLTWATIKHLIGPCLSTAGGQRASGDQHRYYERAMSKKEIGQALGQDGSDRKISEKVDALFRAFGCDLRKLKHANYLVPLDVLPSYFLDRFRRYVKDFDNVDL